MGLQTVPAVLGSSISHPVQLFRNQQAAAAGRRTGAFRYNDFALTPSGSAMQLAIGAGDGFLMGTEQNTQGGYYAWSNASENIVWPAASGSPRIDSLVLRIIDTNYGTDAATPQALWEVVQGTPSGSPVQVPDINFASGGGNYRPGAWWRMANFLVPNGTTNLAAATLTHQRKYARLGRNVLCLSTDMPTDAQLGDTAFLLDKPNVRAWYSGTAWLNDDKPIVRLIQPTTGTTVASNTEGTLSFGAGSEEIKTDTSLHSTSTNPTRITPNKAGLWRVTSKLIWSFNTSIQYSNIGIAKNGSMLDRSGNLAPTSTNNVNKFGGFLSVEVQMNGTTDYLETIAFQTSAGAVQQVTNPGSSSSSTFSAEWLRY